MDGPRLAALVERQAAAGVDGLVVCALAGEGPALTTSERRSVVRIAVEAARGRMPVIAAAGTSSTQKTIELIRAAEEEGAAAVIVVTPYYTRPTQDGLLRHYEAIARASELPVIVENDPGRANIELAARTIAQLAEIETMIGLADETRDPVKRLENAHACGHRLRRFVSGDAGWRAEVLSPHGCISVAANLVPAFCRAVWLGRSGIRDLPADEPLECAAELCRILGAEPDASEVKYALSELIADFEPGVRLPLVGPAGPRREAIRAVIADARLRDMREEGLAGIRCSL